MNSHRPTPGSLHNRCCRCPIAVLP
jgi:hypothetical protein